MYVMFQIRCPDCSTINHVPKYDVTVRFDFLPAIHNLSPVLQRRDTLGLFTILCVLFKIPLTDESK